MTKPTCECWEEFNQDCGCSWWRLSPEIWPKDRHYWVEYYDFCWHCGEKAEVIDA